ncbi:MAG: phosphatase PAP2 family protein [Myxococcales bacterium]|nr:phosphatase PAP2 family protein [Myxococcales bacterium]
MERSSKRLMWAAVVVMAIAGGSILVPTAVRAAEGTLPAEAAAASAKRAPSGGGSGWWHSGYLVDYGLIGLGGAAYLIRNMEPSTSAMFGPVYDPNNPAAILDSKYSDRIGRTHLEEGDGETVSTRQATILVAAGGLYLGVEQAIGLLGDDKDRYRMFHETFVGYLETVALAMGSTALIKNFVGRLRPDFQDRVRRWHCAKGELDASMCPAGIAPLSSDAHENEKIWFDGRRSFLSGHSVSAMNFSTYLSLSIGGQYVWGDRATPTSRTFGLAAQALLLSTGVFVAASRVDDGRHHFGDVMTGSIFGLAVANFSYWRRFGIDGRPRNRKGVGDTQVTLEPGPGDAGLAVMVRYK